MTFELKYSADYVETELTDMLKQLKANKEIVFLGELFEDREYSRQRFSEWVNTFANLESEQNANIQNLSDTIKEILESRAVSGGMKGTLNAGFTQFHLKNNYRNKYEERIKREDTIENINGEQESILNDISE